jgi:hypothetical protein
METNEAAAVQAEQAEQAAAGNRENQRFRVELIALDPDEEVTAVHATCDDGTLSVIEELAGGLQLDLTGRAGGHAQDARIRMPVETMLKVWRAQDTMPGTDPRYRHQVSSSLGRVYFGLIAGEDER